MVGDVLRRFLEPSWFLASSRSESSDSIFARDREVPQSFVRRGRASPFSWTGFLIERLRWVDVEILCE
jgi:hypothetical protein